MANIAHETITLDATDKILGRFASQIARSLIGKTSAAYQPHIDAGATVVVTNVDKLRVTGKKMTQKMYYHHTGHPGGLRTKSLEHKWNESPAEVLRMAVSRMLPKNRLRTARLLRLKIK